MDIATILTIIVVVAVIYTLPSIIVLIRGHRNRRALIRYNILGGWMIFPWFITMVWATYNDPSSR